MTLQMEEMNHFCHISGVFIANIYKYSGLFLNIPLLLNNNGILPLCGLTAYPIDCVIIEMMLLPLPWRWQILQRPKLCIGISYFRLILWPDHLPESPVNVPPI